MEIEILDFSAKRVFDRFVFLVICHQAKVAFSRKITLFFLFEARKIGDALILVLWVGYSKSDTQYL